jgi:hypothetical protein
MKAGNKPAARREKPSRGTVLAARLRAECNHHTREQRAAGAARAMSIIYGTPAPHAANTLCG